LKIFLLGFMGNGKRSLGKKLARYLGYEFKDLDSLIEESAGMKIPAYFNKYGEEAFRELESRILKTYVFAGNTVIATGGGAPCYFDNIEWMNRNGKVVYLSLPPKALQKRLENSRTERPLVKDMKGEELLRFISSKLEQREIYYKQAGNIVSAIDITPKKLSGYLNLSQDK